MIYLPKERYHIPMFMNEKKVEVGDIEKYTVVERIENRPFKVDLKTLTKYNTKVGTDLIVIYFNL